MTYYTIKGSRCSNTDHTTVGHQYFTYDNLNSAYKDLERLRNKWDCGCTPDIKAVKEDV